MAASDEEAQRIAEAASEEIDRLTREAFAAMLAEIQAGQTARAAVAAAFAGFEGAMTEALAASFAALLQRSISAGEVRDMPVGTVSLSGRLYAQVQQVQREVEAIVSEHVKGLHDARALALRLYDGYSPGDAATRPLEGRARAALPEALRMLTADSVARSSLEDVIRRYRDRPVKTAALRAAYEEAISAWEKGAAADVLRKRLDVAAREKTRFMASRIARTELARAHQAQVSREIMADESVEVVEVVMSPSHPRPDICDLHARADLWGLGRGRYPKSAAPRPPYHPFCWCRLRPRRTQSSASALRTPASIAAHLAALDPATAAAIMGSRERLARVIRGEDAEAVINEGRPYAYHVARVGDPDGHPLVK